MGPYGILGSGILHQERKNRILKLCSKLKRKRRRIIVEEEQMHNKKPDFFSSLCLWKS